MGISATISRRAAARVRQLHRLFHVGRLPRIEIRRGKLRQSLAWSSTTVSTCEGTNTRGKALPLINTQ